MISIFQSKASRRAKIRQRPFPSEWLDFIMAEVPYYQLLPPEDQEELQGHIQVFLAEKTFIGAQGFEVTDFVRVIIAAQACILLLHRDTDYFPEMDRVVVYPTTFVGMHREEAGSGMELETPEERLGESSQNTAEVVLAWDSVLRGAEDEHDGVNVVFHEFAHQLDAEDGQENGAPRLPSPARYQTWARVLSQSYDELVQAVSRRHQTVIDPYGATDPAEFFAVVTETFFENPVQLKEKHPDLYGELAAFYQQDPAALMQTASFTKG